MAKRTGSNTWNWEMRKNLEFLVSEEGYPPKKIAKELSVSDATVYLELKRGMTAEEYLNKRYSKYRAEVALYNEAVSIFGIDGLAVVMKIFQAQEEK